MVTGQDFKAYLRADKNRLYFFGLSAFFIMMSGLVLFAMAHPAFYAYGIIIALVGFYLGTSYMIGLFSKEFDYREHSRKVFAHAAGPDDTVDIFFPIAGETIEVTTKSLNAIIDLAQSYGLHRCKVYILDDSKDLSGWTIYNKVIHRIGNKNLFHVRRDDVGTMKKSGNLRNAFRQTTGKFIAVFDADFSPSDFFFDHTLPYMEDPKVAIVQTPQYFRVEDHSTWVGKGAAYVQELFYRLIQVNRDSFQAPICVGTCALYRRSYLTPFGGSALIEYSEDVRTGFNAMTIGGIVKYIPVVLSVGSCPENVASFVLQQHRWSLGSISLMFTKLFWKTKITIMQRLCYLSGMFYYITTGQSIWFQYLPALGLLIVRPDMIAWYNILFSVPSLLFGTAYQAYWSKAPWGLYAMKSRMLSYYAHFFALQEYLQNDLTPWMPTGISSKNKVHSKVIGAMTWSCYANGLIIAICAYRFHEFGFHQFIPTMLLNIFDLHLKLSILKDQGQ